MVSKNRVESVRCDQCGSVFYKAIYEESFNCNRCVSAKYQDVFSYRINLNDRSVMAVLFPLLLAFVGLMGAAEARAEAIPDSTAYACLCGEACNQGITGMIAVGEVLRKRGSTQGVYGCKSDLYDKAPDYAQRQVREAWAKSASSNLTYGADHFENVGRFGKPKWSEKMTETVRIKDHVFYNSKGA